MALIVENATQQDYAQKIVMHRSGYARRLDNRQPTNYWQQMT